MTEVTCRYSYPERGPVGKPKRGKWKKCNEAVYGTSPYCILHLKLPDESDAEYDVIIREKDEKVQEKLRNRDFNFEGVQIHSINLHGRQDITGLNFCDAIINRDVRFSKATVWGNAPFTNVTIRGAALFSHVTIKGDAQFIEASIEQTACFNNATIEGNALFGRATITAEARFENATIGGFASFGDATINGWARFTGATIEGKGTGLDGKSPGLGLGFMETTVKRGVLFDTATIKGGVRFESARIRGRADFNGVTIEGNTSFDGSEIGGELSFRDSQKKFTGKFIGESRLKAEENACRAAKQNCEQRGAKEDADFYFYREMAVRRKQKPQPWKSLEGFFVQYSFGYGVYPRRIILTWLIVAFGCGLFLALFSGKLEDISFGFVAAFIPGYAISHPQPNIRAWEVVGIEAILSTFLWAAFVVIFARKYMR